jgi:SAM-dependent methyltransferase
MFNNLFGVLIQQLRANPRASARTLKAYQLFANDLSALQAQLGSTPDFPISKLFPILHERNVESGTISGHYFHQDLLVAQRIFLNTPQRHVDIGSRTDGFVAHVAAYRPIEVFDIRPATSRIPNIKFVQADLMNPNSDLRHYTDSISCLHAIEHFGLGRYGDPIDANGHLKGLANIYEVLKPGGKFYFSTPIGPQRIEFNAHRVFSVTYLLSLFGDKYQIDQFSYVNDAGDLISNQPLIAEGIATSFNCQYGCGIFEMTKR